MKSIFAVLLSIVLLSACGNSQTYRSSSPTLIGGPCEGCEAIFESGNRILSPVDTLPDFQHAGQPVKITGVIYQPDGKTPAKDVILYIYHTDQKGIYAKKGDEKGWARRHGYNRGWVKTGIDGRYTFYTSKPGIYPTRDAPAHIHPIILEPDGKYYWITAFYFSGDSLLSEKELAPTVPRCGHSGVLDLQKEGKIWVGQRDLILGKNIPGYN